MCVAARVTVVLVPEPSPEAASHAILWNGAAACVPAAAWVRAEHAVLATCLDRGHTVHVAVDEAVLDEHVPETLAALRSLETGSDVLDTDLTAFRATSDDAETLSRALSVGDLSKRPEDSPRPTESGWRTAGVTELAAVDGDDWRYYSVPRQQTTRAVADPPASFRTALEAVLDAIPAAGLAPSPPIRVPAVDEARALLTGTGLRSTHPERDTMFFPYWKLEAAVADSATGCVHLEWETPRSAASSSLGRVVWAAVERIRETPPERLDPSPADYERVTALLETVGESLRYDVEFRRL
ncbi:hypothetical protein GCM10009030_03390 [Haloarcula pellucida]|uniref:Uncharacterized protein n=1 Tax=Haloarcula pellucida TaxID=1427151 RepID=A0A830GGX3_9EURY|nr:hypothetical protein GCM10009030_03390 [Halomicroarcula pellucida]